MGLLQFMARRFIAGETVSDAMAACNRLREWGLSATVDILGENVSSKDEARAKADAYIDLLNQMAESGMEGNVSLKPTMMGLDISDEFCYENTLRVIERADTLKSFVRVDMEGSAYTQRTLDLVKRWHADHKNTGTVIQAMLKRSSRDIDDLIEAGIRVRLCKGAYKEPASIAFADKRDVNRSYVELMERLLDKGNYPAIATHDEQIIEHAVRFVKRSNIPTDRFEFQMLYGIRRGLQRRLRQRGFNVRIYVPYGKHWFPYYSRRLRERKENIFFVLKNLLRD